MAPRRASPAPDSITEVQREVDALISIINSDERVTRSAFDEQTPALQERINRNDEKILPLQRENREARDGIARLLNNYEAARDNKQRLVSYFDHILVRPTASILLANREDAYLDTTGPVTHATITQYPPATREPAQTARPPRRARLPRLSSETTPTPDTVAPAARSRRRHRNILLNQ